MRTGLGLSVAVAACLAFGLAAASASAQWVAVRQPTEETAPPDAPADAPVWSPSRRPPPAYSDDVRRAEPKKPSARSSARSEPRAGGGLKQASYDPQTAGAVKYEVPAQETLTPIPLRQGAVEIGDQPPNGPELFDDNGPPGMYDGADDGRQPCPGCPTADSWRPIADRLWCRGEYLIWWTRGSNLPPLVTTSPVGTLPQDAGILGRADTEILYGDNQVLTDARSGGRFTAGYLLLPCEGLGVEANYLSLGTAASHYQADDTSLPILARPYYDLGLNAQDALLVSHPDFLSGSIAIDSTTDFQGAEVLLRKTLCQGYCNRLDFLVGYRFARLNDGLDIQQFSEWTRPYGDILAGTTKSLVDSFDTQNQFNGGELGLSYRGRAGQWSLELLGKIGLGDNLSDLTVGGSTITTLPDGRSGTFVGGLLAQETNIGKYQRNQFAVLPELGVTVGYNLTCQLRATLGYTFIYWNNVLRAGDQIDSSLSQLPPEPPTGTHEPAALMKTTDFWAQGLRAGVDFCF